MADTAEIIVGCLMGLGASPTKDMYVADGGELPMLLEYCPVEEPLSGVLKPTRRMTDLEVAGLRPVAIVKSDPNCPGMFFLFTRRDTPEAVLCNLVQQEEQIFKQAVKHEKSRLNQRQGKSEE